MADRTALSQQSQGCLTLVLPKRERLPEQGQDPGLPFFDGEMAQVVFQCIVGELFHGLG